jgi:NAD(P)-dependent dehydrogenase (short-subunit alcohol dehydrogenase family)
LLRKGIRINALLPGPTDTPLARANAQQWLGFGQDYRESIGIQAATPLNQAAPLVFLCSPAASYISGAEIVVDSGMLTTAAARQFDLPYVRMMLGLAD